MSQRPDVTINERSSARYTATLLDEAGDPVPAATIEAINLWLRDVATGTYINNREGDDTLDLDGSGVTMHATSGLLTWVMHPDDNQIISATRTEEDHEAVIEVIWNSGEGKLTHRIRIRVKNLVPVPQA